MSADVTILDFGVGNVQNVKHAFARIGVTAEACSKIALGHFKPRRIVIAGQGSFATIMPKVSAFNDELADAVLGRGIPFLGICLGMQILFDGSEEAPEVAGLGYLNGMVTRLPGPTNIGWRSVHWKTPRPEYKDPFLSYFCHSYAVTTKAQSLDNPDEAMRIGTSCVTTSIVSTTGDIVVEQQQWFLAAVKKDNIVGVQFHPEKSGEAGEQFLKNWVSGKI